MTQNLYLDLVEQSYFVGSLVVYKIKDKCKYIFMDMKGNILNGIYHFYPHFLSISKNIKGLVSSQAKLKQVIN